MDFIDYARPNRANVLAEIWVKRHRTEIAFWLGAVSVGVVWLWSGVFAPQVWTEAQAKTYAAIHLNQFCAELKD